MRKFAASLVFCFAMWSTASSLAVEFTGPVTDLRGKTIPNLQDLTVTAETAQGTTLNRQPVKVDLKAGTYSLTVDDDLVRASGSVEVTLVFSAPGRLTLTLDSISAQSNLTVPAILPTADEMSRYMKQVGYNTSQTYYCYPCRRCRRR